MPKTMRNIVADLEKRLESLSKERGQTAERLNQIDKLIDSFTTALEYEKHRQTKQLTLPIAEESSSSGKLRPLIKDALGDGNDWSLAGLTIIAKERSIDFGYKNPNRVVHFVLVGMKKHGLVERTPRGVWHATQKLLEESKIEDKTGEVPTTKS